MLTVSTRMTLANELKAIIEDLNSDPVGESIIKDAIVAMLTALNTSLPPAATQNPRLTRRALNLIQNPGSLVSADQGSTAEMQRYLQDLCVGYLSFMSLDHWSTMVDSVNNRFGESSATRHAESSPVDAKDLTAALAPASFGGAASGSAAHPTPSAPFIPMTTALSAAEKHPEPIEPTREAASSGFTSAAHYSSSGGASSSAASGSAAQRKGLTPSCTSAGLFAEGAARDTILESSRTTTMPAVVAIDRALIASADKEGLKKLKYLLLGEPTTGKSALLSAAIHGHFTHPDNLRSLGVDFRTIINSGCEYKIWDTSGQERFRTITSSYFRGTHAAFISAKDADSLAKWITSTNRQYPHEFYSIHYTATGIELRPLDPTKEAAITELSSELATYVESDPGRAQAKAMSLFSEVSKRIPLPTPAPAATPAAEPDHPSSKGCVIM